MFEKIKKWYSLGLWSANMVQQAYEKGVITQDQLLEILPENIPFNGGGEDAEN